MAISYCAHPSCLKKTEYTSIRPKFCGACGNPFDAAFKRPIPAAAATPPPAPSVARYVPYTPPVEETDVIPVIDPSAFTAEAGDNQLQKITIAGLRNSTETFSRSPERTTTSVDGAPLSTSEGTPLKTRQDVQAEYLANLARLNPVVQTPVAPARASRRKKAK